MQIKKVDGQNIDFIKLTKKLEEFQFDLMPELKEKGYNLTDDLSEITGFILYESSIPVGSIGLKKVSDDRCEIVRVFVDETYRGKGYAKLLFKEIETLAKSMGYKTAEMVAWTKSVSAIALYKKIGYTASKDRFSEWYNGLKYVEFEKELKI